MERQIIYGLGVTVNDTLLEIKPAMISGLVYDSNNDTIILSLESLRGTYFEQSQRLERIVDEIKFGHVEALALYLGVPKPQALVGKYVAAHYNDGELVGISRLR